MPYYFRHSGANPSLCWINFLYTKKTEVIIKNKSQGNRPTSYAIIKKYRWRVGYSSIYMWRKRHDTHTHTVYSKKINSNHLINLHATNFHGVNTKLHSSKVYLNLHFVAIYSDLIWKFIKNAFHVIEFQ